MDAVERIKKFKKNNPTFISFYSAQQRCQNRHHRSYRNYGERGIKFKFSSYREIVNLIGERPNGFSLDRIDNNGHYESGNIKWSSITEQNRNRKGIVLNVNLVKKIRKMYLEGLKVIEISRLLKINRGTINDVVLFKTWKDVGDS